MFIRVYADIAGDIFSRYCKFPTASIGIVAKCLGLSYFFERIAVKFGVFDFNNRQHIRCSGHEIFRQRVDVLRLRNVKDIIFFCFGFSIFEGVCRFGRFSGFGRIVGEKQNWGFCVIFEFDAEFFCCFSRKNNMQVSGRRGGSCFRLIGIESEKAVVLICADKKRNGRLGVFHRNCPREIFVQIFIGILFAVIRKAERERLSGFIGVVGFACQSKLKTAAGIILKNCGERFFILVSFARLR